MEGHGASALNFAVYPNPVRDAASFVFTLPPEVPGATLRVLSLAGRVVSEVSADGYLPGEHTLTWDGREPSGWPAGAGVYLCELRAGGSVARRKITLLHGR